MGNGTNEDLATIQTLEGFLDDLRATTGVSREFLEAARPIVCRLFTDVRREDRPGLARRIRETVSRHALVECEVRRAAALLEARPDGGDGPDRAVATPPPVPECSMAVSVYLRAHGGFGPSEPSLA
jgi:hypothetical protein